MSVINYLALCTLIKKQAQSGLRSFREGEEGLLSAAAGLLKDACCARPGARDGIRSKPVAACALSLAHAVARFQLLRPPVPPSSLLGVPLCTARAEAAAQGRGRG